MIFGFIDNLANSRECWGGTLLLAWAI